MSGLFIEKFKMDITTISLLFVLFLLTFFLFMLFQLLKTLIRKQIDNQMKEMIPLESIRKRVGIRINWRK